MSRQSRDSSSGAGLDVVTTLPAPIVEKIGEAAKERGEPVPDWCAVTLIECVAGRSLAAGVPPEERSFDVRAEPESAPA